MAPGRALQSTHGQQIVRPTAEPTCSTHPPELFGCDKEGVTAVDIAVLCRGYANPEVLVDRADGLERTALLEPAFPLRRRRSGGILRTHDL